MWQGEGAVLLADMLLPSDIKEVLLLAELEPEPITEANNFVLLSVNEAEDSDKAMDEIVVLLD